MRDRYRRRGWPGEEGGGGKGGEERCDRTLLGSLSLSFLPSSSLFPLSIVSYRRSCRRASKLSSRSGGRRGTSTEGGSEGRNERGSSASVVRADSFFFLPPSIPPYHTYPRFLSLSIGRWLCPISGAVQEEGFLSPPPSAGAGAAVLSLSLSLRPFVLGCFEHPREEGRGFDPTRLRGREGRFSRWKVEFGFLYL